MDSTFSTDTMGIHAKYRVEEQKKSQQRSSAAPFSSNQQAEGKREMSEYRRPASKARGRANGGSAIRAPQPPSRVEMDLGKQCLEWSMN
ncbi:hypothetical protein ACQJBY_040776 [Aegilops geniculata]